MFRSNLAIFNKGVFCRALAVRQSDRPIQQCNIKCWFFSSFLIIHFWMNWFCCFYTSATSSWNGHDLIFYVLSQWKWKSIFVLMKMNFLSINFPILYLNYRCWSLSDHTLKVDICISFSLKIKGWWFVCKS